MGGVYDGAFCIFVTVLGLCDAFVNIWVKYIEPKNKTVKTAQKHVDSLIYISTEVQL